MLYLPSEEGMGLVEYGLILIMTAVVMILILAYLGPAVANLFKKLAA